MPWPTYSERFLSSSNYLGTRTWTVPVGKRAVVKAIAIDSGNVATGFIAVSLAGQALYTAYFQAAKDVRSVTCMGVAYGGEALAITTTAAGMACTLYGFLFQDPERRTGPPASAAILPAPEEPWLPGNADGA